MAIAVQNDWGADGGGGTSGTITITAGTNICTYAFIMCTSSTTATGATINGVAMTQIGSAQASGIVRCQMFALPNPSTGTQTLAFTGSPTVIEFSWITLSGIDQTNPVDNANAGFASAANSTASITSVSAAGCWMLGMGGFNGGGITGATGDFSVMFPVPTTDPGNFRSNTTIGTGSQTGSYSTTGSSSTPIIFIAAVNPAAAAGAVTLTTRKMRTGVGS